LNLYFDLLWDNANVRGDDIVDYLRHLKGVRLGGHRHGASQAIDD
jgi:hypothetical protein